MDKKKIFGLTFGVLIIASLFAFSMGALSSPKDSELESGVDLSWDAWDCVQITRVDGSVEDLGCKHNLVTNAGLNLIRDELFGSLNSSNLIYIGLCNASAGAGCTGADAGDTALDNEFTDSGVQRCTGTVGNYQTGNASVWCTFTASATVSTNQTGLFNSSVVAGSTLVAENTFTLANLESGDQLTINKTISLS